MHDHSTLRELLILLGSLTLVATMFHYIKIPTIVGFIISGVIIGPSALGLIQSIPNAEIITEIAVIFLMFTIGLEFSFSKLKKLQKSFWGLGMSQVVFTTLIVAALVYVSFSFSMQKSIFIGSLIAFSSTAVLLKLFEESRQMETPVGSNAIGTLLFQDLAVIPVMLAIPTLAGVTDIEKAVDIGVMDLLVFVGKIVAVGLMIWGGSKYIIPFITSKILKTRSKELFFFFILFLCLGSAYVMGELGVSLSLGAFVAGVIISDSDYGKQVVSDFVPLRDNFLGILFCSVGMLLDLKFLAENILSIIGLTVAAMAVKIIVVFVVLKILRKSNAQSWMASLCLFQIGELSLVLAQAGSDVGILTASEMQYVLSLSIFTMILTPFMFHFAIKKSGRFGIPSFKSVVEKTVATTQNTFEEEESTSHISTFIKPIDDDYHEQEAWRRGNHTIIIGFGVAGRNLADTLRSSKIPYAIIEANYDNFKKLSQNKLPVTFGDASKEKILNSAGIEQARLVVITVSSFAASQTVLAAVQKLRPDVKIIIRVQYLKELEEIAAATNTDVVVAELETSHELVARTMKTYGASAEAITQFMNQSKKEWEHQYQNFTHSHRRAIELPAWEAMAHMRPFHLKSHHFGCGKTIVELNLRSQFDVSVVTVFRKDLGTTLAGPTLVLVENDIIQLIGSDEKIDEASQHLKGGPAV